ncbi:MAG: hypothetical protein LKE39_06440 [Sphaerochaeta sp.]|nr:hypothetical protein [Sphaerochaeta sp.]
MNVCPTERDGFITPICVPLFREYTPESSIEREIVVESVAFEGMVRESEGDAVMADRYAWLSQSEELSLMTLAPW